MPMDTTKPYKVYSYDCRHMHDEKNNVIRLVASFDALEPAVFFCKKWIDHEILYAIRRAEDGLLTTPEQIKEVLSHLSSFGRNYLVRNDKDGRANHAFDFLVYAEQRLTEIVERRRVQGCRMLSV